jgi:hypothetical protein
MSVKVQLKHSATANKAPLATDLVDGELAININAASPAAYIKDSAGAVVKLAGAGSVSTPDATTTSKGIVQLADPAGIAAGTAGLVVDAAQLKAAQATAAGSTTAPAAPAAGKVWVNSGVTPAVINVWNGSSWIPQVGATVTAPAAPTAPAAGQVWVNTSVAPNVASIWDGTAWAAAAPDGAAAAVLANDAKYATKAELAVENLWDRTGTVLSPATAGDGMAFGTDGLVYDAATKRLGIGTASPGSALDVVGEIRLTASIASSGRLLVGTSSGPSDSTLVLQGNSSNSTFNSVLRMLRNVTNPAADTVLGSMIFGVGDAASSGIECYTDGQWGTNDYPGRLVFSTTADGASSPTERMRLDRGGVLFNQGTFDTTTANGANMYVFSDGKFSRSTSSSKYKTQIEPIEDSYSDALLACRPVWYRSTCEADCPDHSYWGFIAEEVAQIDKRLVNWKTVDVSYDENGSVVKAPCDPEPEGVAYDRFVPHLLNLIKRQKEQIEAMEARLTALESA